MKRAILIFLAVCLIMLAGCDGIIRKSTADSATQAAETESATASATDQPTEKPTDAPTEAPTEEPTEPGISEGEMFSLLSGEYSYASAGNWSAILDINSDGIFEGHDHDSNMGESGDGYDATIYICEFSGSLTNPKKTNDYTYSFDVSSFEYENEPDTEQIVDMGKAKQRQAFVKAFGMSGGADTLYLYTDETPRSEAPEKLIKNLFMLDSSSATLGSFCLYDEDTGYSWVKRTQ